jgi:hypothetical protein
LTWPNARCKHRALSGGSGGILMRAIGFGLEWFGLFALRNPLRSAIVLALATAAAVFGILRL